MEALSDEEYLGELARIAADPAVAADIAKFVQQIEDLEIDRESLEPIELLWGALAPVGAGA